MCIASAKELVAEEGGALALKALLPLPTPLSPVHAQLQLLPCNDSITKATLTIVSQINIIMMVMIITVFK